MSEKRPSDACVDFENPSSRLEEPLLKRRKRMVSVAIDAAVSQAITITEVKEESQEDNGNQPTIAYRGFQPGNSEREVDEESIGTTDTAGNQKLPIMFPAGCKVPVCFLCGAKANELSPLLTEKGEFIPWRAYKKQNVGLERFRKPSGEKCRICTNVYALSGFDAKHGTTDEYKKNVHAKGKMDEHDIFLQKRKEWIKDHNDKAAGNHEQSLTRTSKASLKRKLEVVKSASKKIKGRKRHFVETADWDENIDGVFDKNKEVEEFIHGKTLKGCWVFVGRKGVWEGEDEEAMEVRDTTLEGEGSSSLEHCAMDNKKARIEEARLQEIDQREANGVEVKPMQLSSLLALVGCVPLALEDAPSTAEASTALGQENSDDDDDDIVIDSDEEDESDNNEKSRLTNYFQGGSSSALGQDAKAKAAAGKEVKKVAVKVKAKAAKAKINKVDQVVSVATTGPKAAAATAKGNASNVSAKDTLNTIDGRVERISKTVETQIAKTKDVLVKVEFDEDFDGLSLAGESEKQFVEALTAKATDLRNEKKTMQDAIARIDRSRSPNDAFGHLKKELETLSEKVVKLLAFIDFNRRPIKDLQAAVTNFMEVVEMGYALSKPYLLRLVDAHVHLNLLIQNDAEVCSMIERTSKLHAMLSQGLSPEEIQEIFSSKIEAVIVDFLARYIKQLKSSQRKSDLQKSTIERLNTYSEATASGQDFKTIHAAARYGILFVDPINAPAKELADARDACEKMIEGKAPSGDGVPTAVFSFFIGAGNTLYEEASDILSGRVQEMKNQEELEGIIAEVSALETALGEDRCSVGLMQLCHSLLYKIANVMGRKKKDTQNFTQEQKLVLSKHREQFTESIESNMKQFLKVSIVHALLLFKIAFDGKGYIDAKYLDNNVAFLGLGEETEEVGVGNDNDTPLWQDEDAPLGQDAKGAQLKEAIQTEETLGSVEIGMEDVTDEHPTQLRGAIEKAMLRKYLVPDEVYSVDLKSMSSIAATLMDPGLALKVLDVMCALLSKTEAWAVFDKEEVNIDRDSLSSVKPALIALGVKSEMAEEIWQKTILDRYLSHVESDSTSFMSSLQHRIKECLDGNYANLKPELIQTLLSGFPGKKILKKHLDVFFKATAKYAEILIRGSLAKPTRIREALTDMRNLEENMTAFGQELREMGTFGEGLREESLKEFIESVIKKLQTLQQGTMTKTHNDLKKACGLANTLYDGIDTADSRKFCEYMRKESSKLSSKQVGLREKLQMMKNEDPNIAEQAKEATDLDQGPVSSYREASKLENKITQVTFLKFQKTYSYFYLKFKNKINKTITDYS